MNTPADELPDFASLTYDEQRAFLGLPDVRTEVAFARMGLAFRRLGDTLAVGLDKIGAAIETAFAPLVDDIELRRALEIPPPPSDTPTPTTTRPDPFHPRYAP